MASTDLEVLKEAGRAYLKSLNKRYKRKRDKRDDLEEKLDSVSSKRKREEVSEELSEVEASVERMKVERSR
jgi:uncharacterized protein YlxW (UPF0749 family)